MHLPSVVKLCRHIPTIPGDASGSGATSRPRGVLGARVLPRQPERCSLTAAVESRCSADAADVQSLTVKSLELAF